MELLTFLAGSMTQLAGSPPPGMQPDNVEAQIQELEVRDCCDLWECCVWVNVIVTCCNGKPHTQPARCTAKQP